MNRREFLHALGVGFAGSALLQSNVLASTSSSIEDDERILVFVDLNGGNDGLNTVVPYGQYDKLSSYRSNIVVPKNRLLKIDEKTALHPSLQEMADIYKEGNLAIVQGVSYPTPNMSHFRSREVIWSGSGSKDYLESGWMGRKLDLDHPQYPINYPDSNNPDPIVVSFSSKPNLLSQGKNSNFTSVTSNASKVAPFKSDPYSTYSSASGRYAEELAFLREAQGLTLEYNQAIYDRYQKGEDVGEGTNTFTKGFKSIVRLIKGGSKTKVFVLSQGGYDTHGGQVISGDTTTGKHADLLRELSKAIAGFMTDLKSQGLENKVVGVVSSEFGRRIMSNDSLGTDHGHATPWFLFGKRVKGGVYGDSSVLPEAVDKKSNVPMQHDYRDIYQSILEDWFRVPQTSVASIFNHTPQKINLFDETVVAVSLQSESNWKLQVKTEDGQYIFTINASRASRGELKIFNSKGVVLKQTRLNVAQGLNHIRVNNSISNLHNEKVYFQFVTPDKKLRGSFLQQ